MHHNYDANGGPSTQIPTTTVQHKAIVHVVTDDPIEEKKAARAAAKKRGKP